MNLLNEVRADNFIILKAENVSRVEVEGYLERMFTKIAEIAKDYCCIQLSSAVYVRY